MKCDCIKDSLYLGGGRGGSQEKFLLRQHSCCPAEVNMQSLEEHTGVTADAQTLTLKNREYKMGGSKIYPFPKVEEMWSLETTEHKIRSCECEKRKRLI